MRRRRRLSFALLPLLVLAISTELTARTIGSRLLPGRRGLDALPGAPIPGEPNMVADVVTGWKPRAGRQQSFGIPGGTSVNSRGMRGPERPIKKPDDVRRVLLLGDSTVFGVLVRDEHSFARVDEEQLQEIDPKIEVLNGGVPGWTSWQALRALEERWGVYDPDLVVIGTLWSDAQGAERPDQERFAAMGVPALESSHAFILLREWIREIRWGDGTETIRVDLAPLRGGRGAPPTLRVPLDAYAHNLRTMAQLTQDRGGDVALLVLPCIRDPERGEVGDFRDDYRLAMRSAAIELNAPLADTPPAFLGKDKDALFFDDVHPTAAGHRLVAEVLVRSLHTWAMP